MRLYARKSICEKTTNAPSTETSMKRYAENIYEKQLQISQRKNIRGREEYTRWTRLKGLDCKADQMYEGNERTRKVAREAKQITVQVRVAGLSGD